MSPDTLWFTRCPAPTAAAIAIHNGWLAEEFAGDGIAVRSLASAPDRSAHLSHYLHTQPNSFRFGGYVPPLAAAAEGADLKIIGLACPGRTAAILTLPEKAGIGLAGSRLAVPRRLNDPVDWWLATVLDAHDRALARTDLGLADVRQVDVPIAREYVEDATFGSGAVQSLWGARSQFAVQREECMALIRGEVDAIYSDGAMGALVCTFLGLVPIVDLSGSEDDALGPERYPAVLTVSATLLERRPDLVDRWVDRLLNADAWARRHRTKAWRIIAQDTGLPEDLVGLAYSERVNEELDLSLAPERITILQKKHDGLVRHGFIRQPLDLSKWIDPGPLERALARRAEATRTAA